MTKFEQAEPAKRNMIDASIEHFYIERQVQYVSDHTGAILSSTLRYGDYATREEAEARAEIERAKNNRPAIWLGKDATVPQIRVISGYRGYPEIANQ